MVDDVCEDPEPFESRSISHGCIYVNKSLMLAFRYQSRKGYIPNYRFMSFTSWMIVVHNHVLSRLEWLIDRVVGRIVAQEYLPVDSPAGSARS